MSLNGILSIGKTALAISQAQLQVTGNNIANAGNADYTRQTSNTSTARDQQIGQNLFIGTGIQLDSIQRQIDEALQGRLRASTSDSASADTTQTWMGRVESVFNELGDDDLSTAMSKFFSSWSDLANKPQDNSLRQIVLQTAQTLSTQFTSLKSKFEGLRSDVADKLQATATNADELAGSIADLNKQIIVAEGGGGGQANGLRDQRDAALSQLSEMVDIHTIEQPNGAVNVYLGSEPLVIGTSNRGLEVKTTMVNGKQNATLIFKDNKGEAAIQSGQIGALAGVRDTIDDTTAKLDGLAGSLIFEVNKLHASGQGTTGLSTADSTNLVDDPTVALADPTANLKFVPTTGSFVVHVKQKATGLVTSTLVKVDEDGLGGNDTTLNDLAASLDGISGINSSVSGGKLSINVDSSAVEFSFSQDTSGSLAALGINSFFTGTGSFNMGVNQALLADPSKLSAAQNGEAADNQTALAIAGLEQQTQSSLNGSTMEQSYDAMVNGVSVVAASAKNNSTAAQAVKDTLFNQRQALSGVSMDEEAINLMRQQRAFQGASRLISVVNDLMDQVMGLIR